MTSYVEICGYKDFFVLYKVYRHSNTCVSKSTRSGTRKEMSWI